MQLHFDCYITRLCLDVDSNVRLSDRKWIQSYSTRNNAKIIKQYLPASMHFR